MRKGCSPGEQQAQLRGWAERAIIAGLGLMLTFLAGTLAVFSPAIIRTLDLRVYDLLLEKTGFPAPSRVPVLVGIDDASLGEHGQWPWPRYRLAQLIDRLDQAGAQVIALDLLMPEPDRTSPEILQRERQRDLGDRLMLSPPGTGDIPPGNDSLLSAAIAKASVVLGYRFDFSHTAGMAANPGIQPLPGIIVEHAAEVAWPRPTGVLTSLPLFGTVAAAAGFVNAGTDEDGILRRVPLMIKTVDGVFPSLALAALMRATDNQQIRLTLAPGNTHVSWNDRQIPLDGKGNLLLAFRGPRKSYRYLPASAVLSGSLPEGSLRGNIVIVGAWAAGLGDRHVTPVDRNFPGMEVHAVAIDTLLSKTFLQEPPWSRGAVLFCVIFLGLAAAVVFSRFCFLADLILIVAGILFTAGGTWLLFMLKGIFLPPVMPMLLLFADCAVLSLVKYGLEVRNVYRRTCELAVAQDATILGMTSLAASRDKETGGHILRTQRYMAALARELRTLDRYRAELPDENIDLLFKSAPLHDIGKVGIPDAILRKPGTLDEEEYRIMQSHTCIGSDALARTMRDLSRHGARTYLDYACQVTIAHHEKWDGSGYPQGLKGEEIPLAGRLMALADVYDALISERIYKSGLSHEEARELIREQSGSHFDPDIVSAFLRCEREFQRIASEFSDQALE